MEEEGRSCCNQSGLEVKVKGEAWVKFTYGAAQYKQKWVVLQGERGFAAISERDGRDLGVYVKGVVPVHSGEGSNPVDDREWLENDSGVTGGADTGTHTTNKTQLLEIVRLPVAARKELRTVY